MKPKKYYVECRKSIALQLVHKHNFEFGPIDPGWAFSFSSTFVVDPGVRSQLFTINLGRGTIWVIWSVCNWIYLQSQSNKSIHKGFVLSKQIISLNYQINCN